MKEKLFEPLRTIFRPKQAESRESFLKTAENSEFFRMDRTELSSVVNLVQDFSGLRDVRKKLEKFGIHNQTPAKQFYILRYIAIAGTLGNIEDQLVDTTLSKSGRNELLRQRTETIGKFLTLEQELQGKHINKTVLPQNLRWLTLSKQDMENARKNAESAYKAKKNSQTQAQYGPDIDHTSIPPLSDELMNIILEASDSVTRSMEDALKENTEKLKGLIPQISKTKPLTNIPKKQRDGEISSFQIEGVVDKAFKKPLEYPENARNILFRLGLIFDNPYAVIYALEYILVRGAAQNLKKEGLSQEEKLKISKIMEKSFIKQSLLWNRNYSSLSTDDIVQIRQEVEEAFRTHPKVYRTLL